MRDSNLPPRSGVSNIQKEWKEGQSFDWRDVHDVFSWSKTGRVNMAYECIDRHVEAGRGSHRALYYIGKEETITYTYRELQDEVSRWANVLRRYGVGKGDFVFVFLPKHPYGYIAMLAAIRIGAVVGPLFEAFMEEAVKDRINDCEGSISSPINPSWTE